MLRNAARITILLPGRRAARSTPTFPQRLAAGAGSGFHTARIARRRPFSCAGCAAVAALPPTGPLNNDREPAGQGAAGGAVRQRRRGDDGGGGRGAGAV